MISPVHFKVSVTFLDLLEMTGLMYLHVEFPASLVELSEGAPAPYQNIGQGIRKV